MKPGLNTLSDLAVNPCLNLQCPHRLMFKQSILSLGCRFVGGRAFERWGWTGRRWLAGGLWRLCRLPVLARVLCFLSDCVWTVLHAYAALHGHHDGLKCLWHPEPKWTFPPVTCFCQVFAYSNANVMKHTELISVSSSWTVPQILPWAPVKITLPLKIHVSTLPFQSQLQSCLNTLPHPSEATLLW